MRLCRCGQRIPPGSFCECEKLDKHEWKCHECGAVGLYADIRRHLDLGVDCCPDCRSPVENDE